MHAVQKTIVGAQFLFVAFGATVLVPLLVGLDPSVGLFTAGVGTLILHAITKGKVPIFSGIIIGYIASIFFGEVDFQPVLDAEWFALPAFVRPEVCWEAIIFMIPVAIAPVIEHIGDIYAINEVTGKDFVQDPGLQITMLGDGLACIASSIFGGPPVTTYSEVTGAISLTKIADPSVIRIAALFGILFSVLGKLSALLKTIPEAAQEELSVQDCCCEHHGTDGGGMDRVGEDGGKGRSGCYRTELLMP